MMPSQVKPKTIKQVFTKRAALRSKNKDYLAHNQNNVVSVRKHDKNPTKCVGLVQNQHHHLIEM
jgi:hypothetical protein